MFLSHRYKSPEVNRYFFGLLSQEVEVQFQVDEGSSSTNVTRLERLLRKAGAFIGLYGLDPELGKSPGPEELRKASRYFRLELDLAVRSRKPVLIFYDQRLVEHLPLTRSMWSESFDYEEVAGSGGSPRQQAYERLIRDFWGEASHQQSAKALGPRGRQDQVGILVPSAPKPYSASVLSMLKEKLKKAGIERVQELAWPAKLDYRTFERLDALDWAIADVGPPSMEKGLAGYLHGRMLPMLRTCPGERPETLDESPSLDTLFGGVEVGYQKDIVFWKNEKELAAGVTARLPSILFREPTLVRINTPGEADEYFSRAARRKETVFLSYSGKDAQIATLISKALKARFQRVFDYKDGDSIRAGEPWLKEIFDQLAIAAVGVPLVSASYLASGNCAHEAQEIVAKRDQGSLELMPVKLYPDELEEAKRPSWMSNVQYLHWYPNEDPAAVVKAIENLLDRRMSTPN